MALLSSSIGRSTCACDQAPLSRAISNMVTSCAVLTDVATLMRRLLTRSAVDTAVGSALTFRTPNVVASSTRSDLMPGATVVVYGSSIPVSSVTNTSASVGIDVAAILSAPMIDSLSIEFLSPWTSCPAPAVELVQLRLSSGELVRAFTGNGTVAPPPEKLLEAPLGNDITTPCSSRRPAARPGSRGRAGPSRRLRPPAADGRHHGSAARSRLGM
jgi:hypothetical protein